MTANEANIGRVARLVDSPRVTPTWRGVLVRIKQCKGATSYKATPINPPPTTFTVGDLTVAADLLVFDVATLNSGEEDDA